MDIRKLMSDRFYSKHYDRIEGALCRVREIVASLPLTNPVYYDEDGQARCIIHEEPAQYCGCHKLGRKPLFRRGEVKTVNG